MITEDYVSFEVAKLLKEKGFAKDMIISDVWYDANGISYVRGNYSYSGAPFYDKETCFNCPTHQMAMKWLREVHNIHISITFGWVSGYNAQVDWAEESEKGNDKPACCVWRTDLNTTYEVAVEAALKYCLEKLI